MWELQRIMLSWVAPSIYKEAMAQGSLKDALLWLAKRYADQRWNEGDTQERYEELVDRAIETMDGYLVVDALAELAIEYSATTNGGHEVYLDAYTSVPWCSEDEMLAWYS